MRYTHTHTQPFPLCELKRKLESSCASGAMTRNILAFRNEKWGAPEKTGHMLILEGVFLR